jgi:hypothetical protein
MLRNCIVVAALAIGLYCIGVIISADSERHISLGAPTFFASRALAGE